MPCLQRPAAHLGGVRRVERGPGDRCGSGGRHHQSRPLGPVHGDCSTNYLPVSSLWWSESSHWRSSYFSVKDGVFRQYRGARDKDSFISFVEDKKWTQVEEITSWTNPDSVQMTMVSYFFKLSMVLRNVHSTLTEEYQFPYWVSYVAFAVATILLGAILGLLLVCCIDCIFPPRLYWKEDVIQLL